jgi:hypothetical protein
LRAVDFHKIPILSIASDGAQVTAQRTHHLRRSCKNPYTDFLKRGL